MKEERGLESPDRADALVMAWWAGRYMTYDGDIDEEAPSAPRRSKYVF
jgi:hypothetical protein